MALTGGTTTNLSLKKAAESEPYDTDWAEDFNDNLDTIDGNILPLAGGTLTGDLTITQAAATAQLKVKGTGGTYNFSTLTLESDEATDKAWTFIHRKHTDYLNAFIMEYFDGSNYHQRGILTSAGQLNVVGGVSPGPLGSVQKMANVQLTNSQIKNLRATPVELVATPGANYWLELEKVVLILGAGSEALTESADNLVVEFGTSGVDATAAIEMTGFIDQTSNTIISAVGTDITGQVLSNFLDNSLRIKNTGDGEFAGNASADAWMEIIIRYWVHPKIV